MCHVLVIEDEALVAMMIEDAVLDAGATSVAVAATEREAVEAADRQHPDLITSDVHLLQGTGPAAVATILARHGEVPVLFITATPGDCQPCSPPGVVLAKPVDHADLARRFRLLVH